MATDITISWLALIYRKMQFFSGIRQSVISSHKYLFVSQIRSKPIATLSLTNITFIPKEISLNDTNCKSNNTIRPCFQVFYCVNYTGKGIRDPQRAVITLERTDSKLRARENRAWINKTNKYEQKSVRLKANFNRCFKGNNSFAIHMNVNLT